MISPLAGKKSFFFSCAPSFANRAMAIRAARSGEIEPGTRTTGGEPGIPIYSPALAPWTMISPKNSSCQSTSFPSNIRYRRGM